MVHVDDLLFTGSREFGLRSFCQRCNRSSVELQNAWWNRNGDQLSERTAPGTSAAKVVECFEKHFGHARVQKVPCGSALQQEDNSQKLTPTDAKNLRSVIGLLLYLSRDRVDIMFGVKKFASAMSSPSLCSVQRLRKRIGFTKYTGDIGVNCRLQNMVLESSSRAQKCFGFLRPTQMQTGAQTRHTGEALAAQSIL